MGKPTLDGKLLFPSEYVAAVELKGKDVTVTIASVSIQDLRLVGGAINTKPVVSFRESPKRLVMNKTNASTIAELYGDEAEKWVGKRITLYPTKTKCGGATVDCIRIRPKVPGGSAPTNGAGPSPEEQEEIRRREAAESY